MPPLAGRSRLGTMLRERTFRSLRHRNYRLYFSGQIVSFTGSWMQSAALMWLVYDLTADPMWPSMLLVAQIGPTLLLGTAGGNLADRCEKLKLIATCQILFLFFSLLLLGLTFTGILRPWLLLSCMVGNGIVQAVDLPTRLAFVPTLIPRDDLINAVSLNALLFNSARAIGPALAGGTFLLADVLIPLLPDTGFTPVRVGAMLAFAFNAVSYGAVLLALYKMNVKPSSDRGKTSKDRGSVFEGFRLALQTPMVRNLLGFSCALCVFAWPTLTLFPSYTRLVLHRAEKEYSVLVTALGLGALAAALTTATYGNVAQRVSFLMGGACLATCGLFGLALAQSPWLALPSSAMLGFGLIMYLSTAQSSLQLVATEATRGRMMALWAMMLSASAPAGHLLAGRLAQTLPIPYILAGMASGAAFVALGLAVLGRRSIPTHHLAEPASGLNPKAVPSLLTNSDEISR